MQRVALVTGGSSGIGWATAIHLAEQGITTVAAARRLEKMAPLRERGIRTVKLDVRDSGSIETCLAQVREEVGEIDILVNNAGVELIGPTELIAPAEGRSLFDVNFFGLVEMTLACLPHMREQRWGRVINMTSIGGVTTQPFNAWYHASKHAIEGFSKSLRQEVGQFGIGVSTVRPGSVRSEVFDSVLAEHADDDGRWGPDYQESVNKTMKMLRGAVRRAVDPIHVARVVYGAISEPHPKVSYATPRSTRIAIFIMRRLLGETYASRSVVKMIGMKDRL